MPALRDSAAPGLRQLGPTTTVTTACQYLGIGRRNGYRLVQEGKFPVKVIQIGGTYRVVTADLLRVLQIEDMGEYRPNPLWAEYVRQLADQAPELTPAQISRLAILLQVAPSGPEYSTGRSQASADAA